jgi:hypothetical protein
LKEFNKIRNSFINYTATILLIFLISALSYAQNKKESKKLKTNLEIFEQEISSETEKLLFYPEINRLVKFIVWINLEKNKNEQRKFIESVLKQTLNRNKINFSISKDSLMETDDSVYNKLILNTYALQTKYTKLIKNRFLGEKTMERVITSEIGIKITDKGNKILLNDAIKTSYRDEIPYDNYTRFESADYKFTQSVPPNISFFESIIFPVAAVTLSAAAAILFFTIRSK